MPIRAKALLLGVFAVVLFFAGFFSSVQAVENAQVIKHVSITLPFIANAGQFDSSTQFVAELMPGTVAVNDTNLAYSFSSSSGFTETPFKGSLHPVGLNLASTTVNYFIGRDQANWHTQVAAYNDVSLGTVFPGISVALKAKTDTVEKIFTVSAGANPRAIAFTISNTMRLATSAKGELVVMPIKKTASVKFKFSKPIAYQIINGKQVDVPVRYRLLSSNRYGFTLGKYNTSKTLIIDPEFDTLVASTLISGSTASSLAGSIVRDPNGNIFLMGSNSATDFPTTSGAFLTSATGTNPAFIAKFNSTLTQLLSCTYIGPLYLAGALDIQSDNSGNIYLYGMTASSSYPVTPGAYQTNYGGGTQFFVSKLDNNLTTLSASTFIGPASGLFSGTIRIDNAGNVVVVGQTASASFPTTTGAYMITKPGISNFVISKLSANLSSLLASTYFGSDNTETLPGLAIDSNNDIFVYGSTNTSTLPITGGAYQANYRGSSDDFVAKFSGDLTSLLASTYIGGSGTENSVTYGSVDASDNFYFFSSTASTDWSATTTGAYDTVKKGGTNVSPFILKFSNNLSLLAGTFIQSPAGTAVTGRGLALDGFGQPTVFMAPLATDMPITAGAYQTTHSVGNDWYVAKIDANLSTLLGATYIGGSNNDINSTSLGRDALYTDNSGLTYVTGYTISNNFPTSTMFNGYQTSIRNGSGNVALVVIASVPSTTSITPTSVTANTLSTIVIAGNSFAPSTTVQIGGTNLPAANVVVNSATQITATIPAAFIPSYGTTTVTVANGGFTTSTAITLTINNPAPSVLSANPGSFVAGTSDTTITISGTGFTTSSVATIGSTTISTTYVNSTSMRALIPANLLANSGTFTVRITNPSPGGGVSSASFIVYSLNGGAQSTVITDTNSLNDPLHNQTTPLTTSTIPMPNHLDSTTTQNNTSSSVHNQGSHAAPDNQKPSCAPAKSITRTLKQGSVGLDVQLLQKFLNCNGFVLAQKGPGSLGKETTIFAGLTKDALIKFQKSRLPKKSKVILGVVDALTRNLINKK